MQFIIPNAARAVANMLPYADAPRIRVYPRAKFFWDAAMMQEVFNRVSNMAASIERAIYFTSMTARNADERHEVEEYIRKSGFVPQIIAEPGDLARSRMNRLEDTRLPH